MIISYEDPIPYERDIVVRFTPEEYRLFVKTVAYAKNRNDNSSYHNSTIDEFLNELFEYTQAWET